MVKIRCNPSANKAQAPLSPLLLAASLSRKKASSFSPAPMADLKSQSSTAHLPALSLLFSNTGGAHGNSAQPPADDFPPANSQNYTSTVYQMRQRADCKFIRECPYCDYRVDRYPGVKEGHLLGHDEFFDSLPEHEKQEAYVYTRLKCRCPKTEDRTFNRTDGLWRHVFNARAPGCMPAHPKLHGEWLRKMRERGMDKRIQETLELYSLTEEAIAAADVNANDKSIQEERVKMVMEAYCMGNPASAPEESDEEMGPTQYSFVNEYGTSDPVAPVPVNPVSHSQITWLNDPSTFPSTPSAQPSVPTAQFQPANTQLQPPSTQAPSYSTWQLPPNPSFVPTIQQPEVQHLPPGKFYYSTELSQWIPVPAIPYTSEPMQHDDDIHTAPADFIIEDTGSMQSTPAASTSGSDLETSSAGPGTPASGFLGSPSAMEQDVAVNFSDDMITTETFFNADGAFNMGGLLGLPPAGSSLFDEKAWEGMSPVFSSATLAH